MRDTSAITVRLQQLGLSGDEASIFMCVLNGPKTQLQISRETGIARSNVYRIVDGLVQKSILHEQATDKGKDIAVSSPEALELLVAQQEVAVQARRANFGELLPLLRAFQSKEGDFLINTYSGKSGLKQMLWNELKTQGEILIFSCGSLNDALGGRWSDKFRAEVIRRGIKSRNLENDPKGNPSIYPEYAQHYQVRYLPEETLAIKPEITIHDSTISIYNSWTHDIQLGTEIKNPFLATFMRQVFEQYWSLATDPGSSLKS